MHSLRVLGAVVLLLSLLRADTWTGKAVGITDGDTVRRLKDWREFKIRLHGIDAPEEGQPFSARAKQYLSSLAFGKDIRAEVLETDKYGRSVALLYLPDGRCINHELVRHGFAWWYRPYAQGDTNLARLEKEAREGELSLWGEKDPIPPWDWRRGSVGRWRGIRRLRGGHQLRLQWVGVRRGARERLRVGDKGQLIQGKLVRRLFIGRGRGPSIIGVSAGI